MSYSAEQTKRQSIIEAILNTFSGMMLAFCISQLAHYLAPTIREYIWNGFVWDINAGSNFSMTIVLTLVSVGRSYAWRRHFNGRLRRI